MLLSSPGGLSRVESRQGANTERKKQSVPTSFGGAWITPQATTTTSEAILCHEDDRIDDDDDDIDDDESSHGSNLTSIYSENAGSAKALSIANRDPRGDK